MKGITVTDLSVFFLRETKQRWQGEKTHIQGLLGAFLILAFGLCIGLPGLYKHSFVPQASIVRVIGATGEQCYESVQTEGLCFKQKKQDRHAKSRHTLFQMIVFSLGGLLGIGTSRF